MPPEHFSDNYYIPILEEDLRDFLLTNSCEGNSPKKPVLAIIKKHKENHGKRNISAEFYSEDGMVVAYIDDFATMTAEVLKIKRDGKVESCRNHLGAPMPKAIEDELSQLLGYSVEKT